MTFGLCVRLKEDDLGRPVTGTEEKEEDEGIDTMDGERE